MIKVITGNNWFRIKLEIDKDVDEFLKTGDKLNIERFNAGEDTINQIESSLGSISLFSDKKLVIVEDLSQYKDQIKDLDEFLAKVGYDTTLLIVETNIDKRSGFYKTLKSQKNFIELNELDEAGLISWVGNYVESNGGQISRVDSSYLVGRAGLNQTNMQNELTKLLAYDKNITKSSIDLLTEAVPTSTIFNLVETAFSGNLEKALKLYDEQRMLKVEPQAIFGMLVWQMHLVAVCLAGGSKNAGQISAETGINSFVLGKAKNIAAQMGKDRIIEYLDLLRDIEKTSRKQTYNFDDAMKLAITKLAY